MTVSMLVHQLSEFPQDQPVFVDAFEFGLSQAYPPRAVEVRRADKTTGTWCDPHVEVKGGGVKGVLISRFSEDY